jgi:hypothetical protein
MTTMAIISRLMGHPFVCISTRNAISSGEGTYAIFSIYHYSVPAKKFRESGDLPAM